MRRREVQTLLAAIGGMLAACSTQGVVGLDPNLVQDAGAAGASADAGAAEEADASTTGAGSIVFIKTAIDVAPPRQPTSPDPRIRVAIGPDLVPQVVYVLSNHSLPKYARYLALGWSRETVDRESGPKVPYNGFEAGLALAVDGDNVAHAVYTSSSGAVTHGIRTASGAWSLETVAPWHVLMPPGRNAIAIGRDGLPLIAFEDARVFNGGVHLIGSTGSAWSDLAEPSNPPGGPDLRLDSSGVPNVLIASDDSSESYVERRGGNGWIGVYCGTYCGAAKRFAIDGRDRMHYLEDGVHKIWNGTTPSSGMIEPTDPVVESAIAVDHHDRVHFAYRVQPRSAAPPKVKYALFDGQTYAVQEVDVDPRGGYGIDLAVDAQERPIIVYYHADSSELRAAMPAP
jgi:hypothetical protein